MTEMRELLDVNRVRELFDLRSSFAPVLGGAYEGDPYPAWADLRDQAPVHPGVVHELSGIDAPLMFHGLPYPDRPHFSAFTYAACDAAYRDQETFASSAEAVDFDSAPNVTNSMLSMNG